MPVFETWLLQTSTFQFFVKEYILKTIVLIAAASERLAELDFGGERHGQK